MLSHFIRVASLAFTILLRLSLEVNHQPSPVSSPPYFLFPLSPSPTAASLLPQRQTPLPLSSSLPPPPPLLPQSLSLSLLALVPASPSLSLCFSHFSPFSYQSILHPKSPLSSSPKSSSVSVCSYVSLSVSLPTLLTKPHPLKKFDLSLPLSPLLFSDPSIPTNQAFNLRRHSEGTGGGEDEGRMRGETINYVDEGEGIGEKEGKTPMDPNLPIYRARVERTT